jgi:hypothetical protein
MARRTAIDDLDAGIFSGHSDSLALVEGTPAMRR